MSAATAQLKRLFSVGLQAEWDTALIDPGNQQGCFGIYTLMCQDSCAETQEVGTAKHSCVHSCGRKTPC